MNDRINQILTQMAALAVALRTAVHKQESRMFFQIRHNRVEFVHSIRQAHSKLKRNAFRWPVDNSPYNPITGPFLRAAKGRTRSFKNPSSRRFARNATGKVE